MPRDFSALNLKLSRLRQFDLLDCHAYFWTSRRALSNEPWSVRSASIQAGRDCPNLDGIIYLCGCKDNFSNVQLNNLPATVIWFSLSNHTCASGSSWGLEAVGMTRTWRICERSLLTLSSPQTCRSTSRRWRTWRFFLHFSSFWIAWQSRNLSFYDHSSE